LNVRIVKPNNFFLSYFHVIKCTPFKSGGQYV
jgi:hypothetical protein